MSPRRTAYLERYHSEPPVLVLRRSQTGKPRRMMGLLIVHEGYSRVPRS